MDILYSDLFSYGEASNSLISLPIEFLFIHSVCVCVGDSVDWSWTWTWLGLG